MWTKPNGPLPPRFPQQIMWLMWIFPRSAPDQNQVTYYSVDEKRTFQNINLLKTPLWTVMKCFKRLVIGNINTLINITLDSHQKELLHRWRCLIIVPNNPHPAEEHQLLHPGLYRHLNWYQPTDSGQKLLTLGLSPSLGSWVLNLMTNRPQTVRSTTAPPWVSLSTCSPQAVWATS